MATISTFPLSSLAKQVASTCKISSLVVPFLSRDPTNCTNFDLDFEVGDVAGRVVVGCPYSSWVSGWAWWSLIVRLALRMILGVISDLVADEAFVVLHIFHSLNGRKANGVNVHDIGVSCCFKEEGSDAASSSESSDPFLLSVEFTCLFDPFV